jgi:DNA-binding transcriptional LysR family regulator
VRLAITPHFARSFLFPRLAPLFAKYPELQVEVLPSQRRADLTRDEADIALRFQTPGAGAPAVANPLVEVQSRRLGSFGVGVFASRAYIARAGHPKNAHAMRGHDVILANDNAPHIPGRAWFDRVRTLGRSSIRVDVAGAAAAVSAGLGVSAVVDLYAEEHSNLVRITPPETVDSRDLWILMPRDLVRVARVRVVWDFIVDVATKRSPAAPGPPRSPREARVAPDDRRGSSKA